jgi:hypothetical protein
VTYFSLRPSSNEDDEQAVERNACCGNRQGRKLNMTMTRLSNCIAIHSQIPVQLARVHLHQTKGLEEDYYPTSYQPDIQLNMKFLPFALCAAFWLQQTTCLQPALNQQRIPLQSQAGISKTPEGATPHNGVGQNESILSRRHLFQGATSACVTLSVLGNPFFSRANAAAPITVAEADSFTAKAQRLLRPKPPKALRPTLNKDFAVLLMRSSYNALDELDCVAMVRSILRKSLFFHTLICVSTRKYDLSFLSNMPGPIST